MEKEKMAVNQEQEVNTVSKLNKKPVVKVLMEKKEVIYASEAAGYCSDQC